MTILIEINNGQPIPLMWYVFILLFFRILALANIAKQLTTGPRLLEYWYHLKARVSFEESTLDIKGTAVKGKNTHPVGFP